MPIAGDPLSDTAWTHTVTGGPWPERIGHRCRIVPELFDRYPWHGRDPKEAVVFIENDPLVPPVDDWTCCLDRRHLEPLET